HDRRIGGQKNAARPQAAPAGSLKPLPVSSVPLRRQSRNGPMNTQLLITLALLLASMMLFIRNKPRMDVVALLVIVALPLSGVLTVQEAVRSEERRAGKEGTWAGPPDRC